MNLSKTNKFRQTAMAAVTIVFLLATLHACGSKSKTAENDTSQTNTDTVSKRDEFLYVWVDNLRARKAPGKDGEILVELRSGERLVYMDENSSFTETVELRGHKYTEPWLKVKLPDGRIGWVFGGAVTSDKKQVDLAEYAIIPGDRVGRIKFSFTKKDIIAAYGQKNVKEGEVYVGEGQSVKGLLVYPDTENALEIIFNERGTVDVIFIREEGSRWTTEEGIKNGISLKEARDINGDDIQFSGFDWDYGGRTLGYGKGKLAKYGFRLNMEFQPTKPNNTGKFQGDQEYSTKDEDIWKLAPVTQQLILSSGRYD